MKKMILVGLMTLESFSANELTDVTLKLNHRLGLEEFALDQAAVNNLGQSYKTTRLEYYISKFIIFHDGGIETAVPLEVIALVQPGEETSTSIPLGAYDITSVESIQFSIGVYEPINNGDPTLFDESHPLGPKSPSMHWGWAAGYRFVAYEGFGGMDYSQNFQLHGLGNDNYFRQEQEVITEMVDGVMILNLDANYTEALRDIDVSSGVVSHGETGAALKMLENFRDYVFGNYFASIAKNENEFDWKVYPNPTNDGTINVKIESDLSTISLQVVNAVGQMVLNTPIQNGQVSTYKLPDSGVYLISIYSDGQLISTERLVVY